VKYFCDIKGIPTGVNTVKYDISPLVEDPEIVEVLHTPINFNDMISDLLIMGETGGVVFEKYSIYTAIILHTKAF